MRRFCREVQDSAHGNAVTIQLLKEDPLAEETLADGLPLRLVALDDTSDPCNFRLMIEAGSPEQKTVRHVVVEPIHIRLIGLSNASRYNEVHILGENGSVRLEFHPGLDPDLVNRTQK